jgi:hypothetical protein
MTIADPTTDMYTTLERSIQQTIQAGMRLASLGFPVFNNQIDTKKFKDSHEAIGITKVSDVPNYGLGGGAGAFLYTPVLVSDVVDSYIKQPWPDAYDVLYQLVIQADSLTILRQLENMIRNTLRPRQVMYLWNSTADGFSSNWVNYHFAGYINRDISSQSLYWRVINVRFEMYNLLPGVAIPAVKTVNLDLEPVV